MRQRLRDKYQIEVKIVPNNWLNGNRMSTHLFNTEKEVDSLVAALTRELA